MVEKHCKLNCNIKLENIIKINIPLYLTMLSLILGKDVRFVFKNLQYIR